MSNFIQCIMDKVKSNEISNDFYKEIKDIIEFNEGALLKKKMKYEIKEAEFEKNYKELREKYLSDKERVSIQEKSVLEALYKKKIQNYQKAKQIESMIQIKDDLKTFGLSDYIKGIPEADRANLAALAILTDDLSISAPYSSVEAKINWTKGVVYKDLSEFVQMHMDTLTGKTRNLEELDNVVDELFGKSTGSEYAKRTSENIKKVQDLLHKLFVEAGGDLKYRKDFGLSTDWDKILVIKQGKAKWIADVKKNINKERTFDQKTGVPYSELSEMEIQLRLEGMYEEIVNDKYVRMNPQDDISHNVGKSKIADERNDPRTLQWKDGESFRNMHNKYSTGDMKDVINGQIQSMARDVAIMQRMGPDSEKSLSYLKQVVADRYSELKSANPSKAERLESKKNSAIRSLDKNYQRVLGRDYEVVDSRLFRTIKGLKNLFYASKLGSTAIVAAAGDLSLQANVVHRVGGSVGNMFKQYGVYMGAGADAQVHIDVALTGYFADNRIDGIKGVYRMEDGASASGWTDRVAGTVLRTTGLERTTESSRIAGRMAVMGAVVNNSSKPYSEINAGLRKELALRGILENEWEILRNSPVSTSRTYGGVFISPYTIEDSGVAQKYFRFLEDLNRQGTIMPSERINAIFHHEGNKGTRTGLWLESVKMLKTFPIGMYYNNLKRVYMLDPKLGNRLAETVSLASTALVGGMFATVAYDFLVGKNPISADYFTSKKFITDSVARSGMLPLLDVFIQSNKSTMSLNTDIFSLIAGPLISEPVRTVTFAKKEITDFGGSSTMGAKTRRVAQQIQRNLPGQNHWLIRTPLQRMVFENVYIAMDPQYRSILEKQNSTSQNEGQKYYWKRGRSLPFTD